MIRDSQIQRTEDWCRGAGRGEWAKWGMGIKEGTRWDDPWVLYVTDESLNSTPETIVIPYVN